MCRRRDRHYGRQRSDPRRQAHASNLYHLKYPVTAHASGVRRTATFAKGLLGVRTRHRRRSAPSTSQAHGWNAFAPARIARVEPMLRSFLAQPRRPYYTRPALPLCAIAAPQKSVVRPQKHRFVNTGLAFCLTSPCLQPIQAALKWPTPSRGVKALQFRWRTRELGGPFEGENKRLLA
jgi:hypothetical protein